MEIQPEYDCVVLGGGPAGCTAAALVAEAGFSTLLVERETRTIPYSTIVRHWRVRDWPTLVIKGLLLLILVSSLAAMIWVLFQQGQAILARFCFKGRDLLLTFCNSKVQSPNCILGVGNIVAGRLIGALGDQTSIPQSFSVQQKSALVGQA